MNTEKPLLKIVLVVEDDDCLKLSINRCLRAIDRNLQIEWVGSVDEAEAYLQTHTVSLIIADHGLLGFRTGLDLWNSNLVKTSRTPFVMISGYPVEYFVRQSTEMPLPPILTKPFSLSEFNTFVSGHFNSQKNEPEVVR